LVLVQLARKAAVVGEIKNNRFVVSSFKLLPEEKETEQPTNHSKY
jgi:hypothetical protein